MKPDQTLDMFIQQILAMAWIRCVIEEGVDFKNKQTGKLEKSEKVIFESLEKNEGFFDVPPAKGSKYGLEKNILEVIGGLVLYNDDPTSIQMMTSVTFRKKLKAKLLEIAAR